MIKGLLDFDTTSLMTMKNLGYTSIYNKPQDSFWCPFIHPIEWTKECVLAIVAVLAVKAPVVTVDYFKQIAHVGFR